MKRYVWLLIVLVYIIPVQGQTEIPAEIERKDALKIFLDCDFCDQSHIKRNIPYLNYVRDSKEGQVHVMVTSQRTGSGGREYTFHFLGQMDFEGLHDTLTYSSNSNNTREEVRDGQIRALQQGLMRYVSKTPMAEYISISYDLPTEEEVEEDPWNSWVFNADIGGSARGEQSVSRWELEGSFRAFRVTPEWKIDFDADYSQQQSKYETSTGTLVDSRHNEAANILVVKSLTDHWSGGGNASISSSTYRNIDLSIQIRGGFEYNIFPYQESTRKQLRILYRPGAEMNRYVDTTIYDKIQELLFSQRLDIAFEVTQKWGSINTSIGWKNYFHNWGINNLYLRSNVHIRIVKGLRFNFGGSAGLIHDQINLPKGGATDEEILLRRKELETNFNYRINIGLDYTFGSIYNNVVNPRFGGR